MQDSVAMPAPAGVLFFALVLGSGPLTPWLGTLGLTPLMAAVLVGAAQNVFSKSAKYSLFDPCKEMAYIPLDQETQLKGKAAIDVVCNPLVSCPCATQGSVYLSMQGGDTANIMSTTGPAHTIGHLGGVSPATLAPVHCCLLLQTWAYDCLGLLAYQFDW